MGNIIYIRMPRAASTSIVEWCKHRDFLYFGGHDMGMWGEDTRIYIVPKCQQPEEGDGDIALSRRELKHPGSLKLARCVEELLGPKLYSKAFKFSSMRNPWDRAVSLWHLAYRCLRNYDSRWFKGSWCAIRTFRDFCKAIEVDDYPTPIARWHAQAVHDHLFNEDGKALVDQIVRVENLQKDINSFCNYLGVPSSNIEKKNQSQQRENKHYSKYYDDGSREIIAKKYHKDIELGNYKFEEEVSALIPLGPPKLPERKTFELPEGVKSHLDSAYPDTLFWSEEEYSNGIKKIIIFTNAMKGGSIISSPVFEAKIHTEDPFEIPGHLDFKVIK